MINIEGLNKAEVLAALYNASKAQGMGLMHFDPKPMSRQDAEEIIHSRGDDLKAMFGSDYDRSNLYFDYLKGRVMKVDLSGDSFDEWGYDRDLGQGAARRAISKIKSAA